MAVGELSEALDSSRRPGSVRHVVKERGHRVGYETPLLVSNY